jgi:TorA maturation chaperone TorD
MQASDLAASAEDRSRFFWWLAEWFLNPPSRDMLAGLAQGDESPPQDAMDAAWLALARAVPDPESASLEALGAEFTRLLGGVQEGLGPPPPFESVWREDRLIGESTVAVIEAYARAGFADIAPEAGPQDHIAVELKFLALLALREMEAWRGGDVAGAEKRLAQQREFLERHLATWVPRWADRLKAEARMPLFAALAELTRAGLDQASLELAEPARLGA